MKFNKLLTFLGGMGLFVYDVFSIIKGQTHGLAATGFSRMVLVSKGPVYFWFSVIVSGIIGLLLMYSAIKKKGKANNYEN